MHKFLTYSFLLALVLMPLSSFAHEHQVFRIGNKTYEFTIGSLNEPIVIDDKTGVDLRVVAVGGSADDHGDHAADFGDHGDHAAGIPVMGLEQTLKVELIAGNQKKVQDLSPAFGAPGAYKTVFYPTVQTTFSYRLFGKINDVPVDLTFTCNPAGHPRAEDDNSEVKLSEGVTRIKKSGAFGCAVAKGDLGFPEKSASLVDLNNGHGNLNNSVSMLKGLAGLALLLGVAGTAVGVLAMRGNKNNA